MDQTSASPLLQPSVFNAGASGSSARFHLPGTQHFIKTATEERIADLLQAAEEFRLNQAWYEAEKALTEAAELSETADVSGSVQSLTWAINAEYQEQLNRSTLALDCYELAVKAAARAKTDPSLRYHCHNNLAYLQKASGKYEESESNFVKASQFIVEAAMDRHFDNAIVHNNLGVLYHATGYFEFAAQLHQMALNILQQASEAPISEKVRTLRMLALSYLFQNKETEALAVLERIREYGWEVSGASEEKILELLITEAFLRVGQGQVVEAERFAKKAISYCGEGPRALAPMLPMLYTNLAAILVHDQKYQEAADLLQDAHLMLLSNLYCTEKELALSHQNQMILAAKLQDVNSFQIHQRRLEKLQHEPGLDMEAIKDYNCQQLARCLFVYRPAALKAEKMKALGENPVGLMKLKSWLREGESSGKTMAIPKLPARPLVPTRV